MKIKFLNFIFNFIIILFIFNNIFSRNPFEFNIPDHTDTPDIEIKVIGSGKMGNGTRFVVLHSANNTKTVSINNSFENYIVIDITNFEVILKSRNGKIKKVEIKKPFNLGQAEGLGGEQYYNVLLV